MDADGSLGPECVDLAGYYKAPYLMQLAGRPHQARLLLDAIKVRFLQPDGDVLTSADRRTSDPVLAAYPSYMGGWIAMGAHRIGRFDLSYPAWRFLRRFWNKAPAGFTLQPQQAGGRRELELLTCAHLGLLALYLGDLDRARGAGRALRRFLDLQPCPSQRFFLRMTSEEQLITDVPEASAGLQMIEAARSGQAWFFIGYPIAFLCRLHQATGEAEPLCTAEGYGAFAQRCRPHIEAEHFAHKVAWGTAELAATTGAQEARSLSEAIVEHLLEAQDGEGTWMGSAGLPTRLDQSAETAIWLLEVSALG
jgi:hypothetical protein